MILSLRFIIIVALKGENPMFRFLHHSIVQRRFLMAFVLTFLVACASERQLASGEPVESSFKEKLAECSMIADRSERNRCLYGN